ncbi:MAG: MoaD/ThiS family protein [Desulfobacterales bacterium]
MFTIRFLVAGAPRANKQTRLSDGDVVSLFPPVGGG